MDNAFIQKEIIKYVAASAARLTPQFLKKAISETYGIDRARAKAVLKDLVARGQLEYTYEFGSSYLVRSFNKPARLSAHVVVRPPGHRYQAALDDVVIQIKPGAAFGSGRHPTTQLAIKAIEYVLRIVSPDCLNQRGSVLDIGTGSGILAITAVCLGVKNALGIDIDPCAIAEAADNVALNNLQNRIVISNQRVGSIDQVFLMVIANLRYPSLKNYYPQISKLTGSGGWVVLSGFRPQERDDLMDLYTANHFEGFWTAAENNWAAMALRKK